jgi:hypothetical protein
MRCSPTGFDHPRLSRRAAIEAGTIGLLGLGMHQLGALRSQAADRAVREKRSCIYIFLSGGLAQHDSFDMKPHAPDDIRGEFQPIATQTAGISICEHLPLLAQRSRRWALCRSLTHTSNEHSAGHHIMLTGCSELPRGFSPNSPGAMDEPSIAAVAAAATRPRNNLPPAVVLPEKLVHFSARVIPGQFAGRMGGNRDPWFIEASPYHNKSYGAYPTYDFDHQERGEKDEREFQAPSLSLPHGLSDQHFQDRLALMRSLDKQRRMLDVAAQAEQFNGFRQDAISLLTDRRVHRALDVTRADERVQQRYGKNAFGWSLLMAGRLVDAGVNLVQVNLGNNETWDTHGNAFPHLKEKLFPPTDRAVSALIDDLHERGLLESTLIVMAGEFGRTPKISLLPQHYKLPGRDHWGAVQTVFLAGGGIVGGRVIGASDRQGAYPADNPQRPENLAATIYSALGIPPTAAWYDAFERPHHIYQAEPIPGLA